MSRLPCGVSGRGLAVAVLVCFFAGSGQARAQQKTVANPLRPTTPVAKESGTSSANAPVGSSVRAASAVRAATQSPAERVSQAAARRPLPTHDRVQQAAHTTRVTRSGGRLPARYYEEYSDVSVLQGTVSVEQPEEIVAGEILADEYVDASYGPEPGYGFGDCCDTGSCYRCCVFPCPRLSFDDLTVFAGAQGYTGPKNRGETGSFGIHEGFNWGMAAPCSGGCLGVQFGARFTHSNLSGAEFTPDDRQQMFLTGGVFRRADWGLQGGIVFDYQADDWYTSTDLTQIRGEASWVFPCAHELGFWINQSLDGDSTGSRIFSSPVVSAVSTETWEATDVYAFFYRHQFAQWEGTSARAFAGFTGASDGLIGGDVRVPLACDLALEAGFTYLVPDESRGPFSTGNEQESWNVSFGIVWYPGCGTAIGKSYFAPLLNVADNGSFLVDRGR